MWGKGGKQRVFLFASKKCGIGWGRRQTRDVVRVAASTPNSKNYKHEKRRLALIWQVLSIVQGYPVH